MNFIGSFWRHYEPIEWYFLSSMYLFVGLSHFIFLRKLIKLLTAQVIIYGYFEIYGSFWCMQLISFDCFRNLYSLFWIWSIGTFYFSLKKVNIASLRGSQQHIYGCAGVKIPNFTSFSGLKQSFNISLELRSNKLYLISINFENDPDRKTTMFLWFHCWKFKHSNVDFKLFVIFIY